MRIVALMALLSLLLPVFADPPAGRTDSGTTREQPATGPKVRDTAPTPAAQSPDEAPLEPFRPSETVPAGSAISFPADI